jgi:UDP-N-acetylglucosamine diphosphorylase/glucosamine-1-phosphate N-acetyltransferase
MNIILFDFPEYRDHLKPITLTRPVGCIRSGILTIDQKWKKYVNCQVSYLTESYLSHKFETTYSEDNFYINASFLPDKKLADLIISLEKEKGLMSDTIPVAFRTSNRFLYNFESPEIVFSPVSLQIGILKDLPSLFLENSAQIQRDFNLITKGKTSALVNDPFTAVYHPENIFIEEGVNIKAAILNAENGPIYIGKNAIVQEGSLIIGPVAIGEGSMVAFGAKIRPNTTLGPVCRVGGEVGNSIFYGYSNKAHDGFLGNSYIGEWCNLGANTNCSNLKNDYKSVKLYDYFIEDLIDTGQIFCGTFMGDFTKAGISTMLNTGTVIGVSANVFGAGFQEKFIDSFTWGGKAEGYSRYIFDKAIEVINATMGRRETSLSDEDVLILKHLAQHNSL